MPLMLTIKVVPGSGRQRCLLDKSGVLKCFLKSPPERGKANTELCSLFSKALGLPRADVTIMLGATARKKVLKIDADITHEQVYRALGIEWQMTL